MPSPQTTKQWILSNKPAGIPTITGPEPTFTLQTADLPPLKDDQVLVKVLYFSNDAGIRTFIGCNIEESRMYLPPVPLGAPMRSGLIGEVLESTSSKFKPGELIMEFHLASWSEYCVLDAVNVQPAAPLPADLSVTHYLGALGASGLAAYVGLFDVAAAKPEHTVVISAAAGATGSMAVQIAVKLLGAKRVVGIAGTDEKCAWVCDHLGAHACVNYKSPTFAADLEAATPDEVDVYFDNVGGAVLDAMLRRMKKHSIVAVCGAVSVYNTDQPTMLRNWFEIVSQRMTIKGFFMFDYLDKVPAAMKELIAAAVDGRIKVDIEDVVPATIEEVPNVWTNMYSGANRGKLVTKLIHKSE
jgi:NADPH-dependent curcumin reductase CurA